MSKTTFVDADKSQGRVGTIISAAFLNFINNHRHRGLDQDGDGAIDYAIDIGAANAYAISLTPALGNYIAGMPIWFKAANANTGAATLNINALGAKAIKKHGTINLAAGDIRAGAILGVMYDGENLQLITHPLSELSLKCWQPGFVYNIGDVSYPSTWNGIYRLECVVAGTSGGNEPIWTGAGILVTDGGVKWIVDDLRDGTPVGRIILDNTAILRPGYLNVSGIILSRAAYPRLWSFAQAYGRVVTEAQWTGINQGCFSSGDGATTFRLPLIDGEFLRAFDNGRGVDSNRIFGTAQADAFQGHWHEIMNQGRSVHIVPAGGMSQGGGQGRSDGGDRFQAQEIIPDGVNGSPHIAVETRSRNIALMACIKY